MSRPPTPSLKALRVLEAATRLESFTAAAAELGLTHGAVSRQVDTLEGWTGSGLFVRSGRRMAPTEAARMLVTQTREALRILEAAFGHPLLGQPAGGLRLSTTAAIARLWLIPRLPAIHGAHPGLISAVETTTTLDGGWSDKVDVAIRYGPGGWPGVQSERLAGESLFPVASRGLCEKPVDWSTAPLVTTPYQSWRPWFDSAGIAVPERAPDQLEVADAGLALDAAIAGLGVALARGHLTSRLLADGVVVQADRRTMVDQYSYFLVWRGDTRRGSEIETLLAWLRMEFKRQ